MTGNACDSGGRPPTTRRCAASIDQHITCELADGHHGRHTNGLLVWHEPPLILINGQPPELDRETDHWVGGQVRLSHERPAP